MFSCGVFGELLYRIETNQIQSYLAQKAHMKIGSHLLPRTLNFQWQPCESNISFKKKLCHLFGFHARNIYPAMSPTESSHPLAAPPRPPFALRSRRLTPHPCPGARSRGQSRRRAPRPCPMPSPVAVGRDVPIAPPHHRRGRGLASRIFRTRIARAHLACGLAVGRDVPIAPPCHRRGARLGIGHTLRVLHAAALSAARCAAGPHTRRDGRPPGLPARAAIFPRALPTRITRAARWSPVGAPHSRPTVITHHSCHTAELRAPSPHPPPYPRALPRPLPARCLPERIPVW